MQLTPWYGSDPLIELDGDPAAVAEPVIRQRRRLVEVLRTFDDDQWAHPSRCEGWSNRDVIVHLDSTNAFWTFSVGAGRRGEPTRFLASFDPVASPVELVAAAGDLAPAEVLERFEASTAAFEQLLASLEPQEWTSLAEAPPGLVSTSALAHHALWDSWVHERDILAPLGRAQQEEPDEVAACLRYAAALAPAFAITQGSAGSATLQVEVDHPDLAFVVEVDGRVFVRTGAPEAPADVRLAGGAVPLLESLSQRAPLEAEVPAAVRWMVDGLAIVFDADPTAPDET